MEELPKFNENNEDQEGEFIELEGIRVYGERAGEVSGKEIEQLEYTPENTMHIVRHLYGLDAESRSKAMAINLDPEHLGGLSKEEFIDAQLESTGSKFNLKLKDPWKIMGLCQNALADSVKSGKSIAWVKEPQGEYSAKLQIKIPKEMKTQIGLDPEEKMGTLSVMPITPDIEAEVKKEQRGKGEAKDQVEVNTIAGIIPPMTDSLIIEIKKRDESGKPYLHTAYTGILAPSLPRPEKQSNEELQYNQEWWDKHAFIK